MFFANDYEGAIRAFESAHELAPHPSDLYNMGRIYEEKGDLRKALAHYEAFASKPKVPLEQRSAAGERIQVLRVLVNQEDGNAESENPTNDVESTTQTAGSSDDGPAGPRIDTDADRSTSNDRDGHVRPTVIAGSVLLSLGTAIAIGGGLGFGLAARRDSDTVEELQQGQNPSRLTLSEAEDFDARGKDFEALQIASLAVGGTMAGVGLALLVTGLVRQKRASPREARGPRVSPQVVGSQMSWRF